MGLGITMDFIVLKTAHWGKAVAALKPGDVRMSMAVREEERRSMSGAARADRGHAVRTRSDARRGHLRLYRGVASLAPVPGMICVHAGVAA